MIDIDTHILAYKKDIALYDGLSDNQAPVIMTELVKQVILVKNIRYSKKAIISGKKPNLKIIIKGDRIMATPHNEAKKVISQKQS